MFTNTPSQSTCVWNALGSLEKVIALTSLFSTGAGQSCEHDPDSGGDKQAGAA